MTEGKKSVEEKRLDFIEAAIEFIKMFPPPKFQVISFEILGISGRIKKATEMMKAFCAEAKKIKEERNGKGIRPNL